MLKRANRAFMRAVDAARDFIRKLPKGKRRAVRIVCWTLFFMIVYVLLSLPGVIRSRLRFSEKQGAYETVAAACSSYYERNSDRNVLGLWPSNGDSGLYAPDGAEIPLLPEEKSALKTVYGDFQIHDNRNFYICVSENYVSFVTTSVDGSYIYSAEDKKPDFVAYSGEEYEHSFFYVSKIVDHWYYANNAFF